MSKATDLSEVAQAKAARGPGAGRGPLARLVRMVCLAAIVILSVGLAAGMQSGRTRLAVVPAAPQTVAIPGPWLGVCRAGGTDCLPDVVIPAEPATAPDWEQQERTQVAPGAVSIPLVNDRLGPADEYGQ